ncbi:translesion DNA synthesis-associated protein ImuA [Shewanella avicenniae]|uniref:Translesion DNA synthesis-associated protein ImuA n=1 Tax=Shewanella avicenniae TaxID=2814294 RepID=A0ABX7QUS6_9GAMM|nr:translesion DNA synthesis-associated protein ImuA [Shewanella avicenniae]QSX35252.1 translesion DNA synthesis-associated protein ImuA [Shewanella avicenniae]
MNSLDSQAAISSLLARQDLWLGHANGQLQSGYQTGFDELQAHLPYWPAHGVCELLSDGAGAGELGLLLPIIESVCMDTDAPILIIAPPYMLNPEALRVLRVPPERFVWLDIAFEKEALWAMEQALRSGSCGLVLGWFDNLSLKAARRLQLAAEEGNCLGFCMLPLTSAGNEHPIPLKLALKTSQGECYLQILKRRGGWPVSDIHLADLAVPLLRRMSLARAKLATESTASTASVVNSMVTSVVNSATDSAKTVSLQSLSGLTAANDRHSIEFQHG